MSEIDNDTQDLAATELASLKAKADLMGLAYHPSIGADKLRAKIQEALNDAPSTDSNTDVSPVKGAVPADEETPGQRANRLKKEANKLVRIRLTCLNPAKKEWNGEIISVGNSVVGTFKKFIPFNAEDGYHVPQIMLDALKAREYQEFRTIKTKGGISVRQGTIRKEFGIEILPPITEQEYNEIAQRQNATGSTE